jgi:hypothetical protein
MTVQLGAGFTTPVPPTSPTGDERRHVELLAELAAVREALWMLAQQGPPQVTVPPTDLTELLHALDGLGVPGLAVEHNDPRAIGQAVADALSARQVDVPDRTDEVLDELRRIGRKFGLALANSVPVVSNDVSDNPTRVLGQVEVTSQPKTESLLTAIRDLTMTLRDNQLRRTDPLPQGNNTIGHVLTVLEAVTLLNLAPAARTVSGTAGPFVAGSLSRVAFDANITAASGVGQSLSLMVDRQGADGIWYPMYTSPAVSAPRTVSTSIGQGMTVGQSLGTSIRLRWEITGTAPSFTFSASLVGK